MNKRRASHVNSPDFSTPDPPKRIRKRNDDTYFPDHETVRTTQEIGNKIIDLLRRSVDKDGRLIADNFLDLPDQNEYPDYYEQIAMPLSINMIDDRLRQGQYATMTELEQDLKRMVQNAKDYNSSGSEIFADAERMRKALSNFMPKHNPAYLVDGFRAIPTPLPAHLQNGRTRDSATPAASEHTSIKLKLNSRRQSTAPPMSDITQDAEDLSDVHLQLLDDLSARENAINFEVKPSRREIPHYYKVIERPIGIADIRRAVQKREITTWDDLARESRLIWTNAKEYNEPGSEIYLMAEELEAWLEERLQANGVPPKVIPKLSLSTRNAQPKQIKLKMNTPQTMATGNGPINGYESGNTWTVDQHALERQKQEMSNALHRARADIPQQLPTPAPSIPNTNLNMRDIGTMATSDDTPPATSVQQLRQAASHQPAVPPAASPSTADTILPAPLLEGQPPQHTQSQPLRPPPISSQTSSAQLNPFDVKIRPSHRNASHSILPSVTLMTNPNLRNDPKWKITRHASHNRTQTSYYTYLPPSHASLRVLPQLPSGLLSSTSGKKARRHKLHVVHNNTILPASPDTTGGGVYDTRLQPGENVIYAQVIAEDRDVLGEYEIERMTFYIYIRGL